MTTETSPSELRRDGIGRRATIGVLAGAAIGAVGVGQAGVASADNGSSRSDFAGSTWSMIVRFPNGLENPTYIQFSKTGEVIETNALTRSMGLGEWRKSGRSRYEYFFWEQIFDANNALTSVVRVSHSVTVNGQGHFEGDGIGTVYDLTGAQIAEVATVITADRLT